MKVRSKDAGPATFRKKLCNTRFFRQDLHRGEVDSLSNRDNARPFYSTSTCTLYVCVYIHTTYIHIHSYIHTFILIHTFIQYIHTYIHDIHDIHTYIHIFTYIHT